MLRVRELAELARRLDVAGFEQQMGPFALVQRPLAAQPSAATLTRTTNLGGLLSKPSMEDFGDLLVATLPPTTDGKLELVIGRSADCDLVLDEQSVSGRHAAVRWGGSAGVLADLGSTNGTRVNQKRAKGPTNLTDGDALIFGRAHFIYMLAATLHRRMRALAK